MAIQFRYSGDRDKAQSFVPFAVRNLLAGFKQRMGFQGLKQNKETYMDTDGNIIQITAQNITGENYQISIFSPIISYGEKIPIEESFIVIFLVGNTIDTVLPYMCFKLISTNGVLSIKPYKFNLLPYATEISVLPEVQVGSCVSFNKDNTAFIYSADDLWGIDPQGYSWNSYPVYPFRFGVAVAYNLYYFYHGQVNEMVPPNWDITEEWVSTPMAYYGPLAIQYPFLANHTYFVCGSRYSFGIYNDILYKNLRVECWVYSGPLDYSCRIFYDTEASYGEIGRIFHTGVVMDLIHAALSPIHYLGPSEEVTTAINEDGGRHIVSALRSYMFADTIIEENLIPDIAGVNGFSGGDISYTEVVTITGTRTFTHPWYWIPPQVWDTYLQTIEDLYLVRIGTQAFAHTPNLETFGVLYTYTLTVANGYQSGFISSYTSVYYADIIYGETGGKTYYKFIYKVSGKTPITITISELHSLSINNRTLVYSDTLTEAFDPILISDTGDISTFDYSGDRLFTPSIWIDAKYIHFTYIIRTWNGGDSGTPDTDEDITHWTFKERIYGCVDIKTGILSNFSINNTYINPFIDTGFTLEDTSAAIGSLPQ